MLRHEIIDVDDIDHRNDWKWEVEEGGGEDQEVEKEMRKVPMKR